MRDLIAFYSWSGHTKTLASTIAQAVQGELLMIEEVKARRKGWGFITGGFQALLGLKTSIKKVGLNPDDYNRIFLGSPIWAGRGVPALNAFLQEYDFSNKKIYLFFTLQDHKPPLKAVETLSERIRQQGGNVFDFLYMQTEWGKELDPEQAEVKVCEWLQKIGE